MSKNAINIKTKNWKHFNSKSKFHKYKSKYPAILFAQSQHDNYWHVLFPYHSPKVVNGSRNRALGGYVLSLRLVALLKDPVILRQNFCTELLSNSAIIICIDHNSLCTKSKYLYFKYIIHIISYPFGLENVCCNIVIYYFNERKNKGYTLGIDICIKKSI